MEESEMSRQYSDEEWEAIRPSKLDRKTFLLSQVQVILTKSWVNRKIVQIFRNTYSSTVTAITVQNGSLHQVKRGAKNTKPTKTSPQWT